MSERIDAARLITPDNDKLREMVEDGVQTEYGSLAFTSEYRSRSAEQTVTDVDDQLSAADYDRFFSARDMIGDEDMITVDYMLGDDQAFVCRYHVPRGYERIPLALDNLMERYDGDREPDFETVQLPDAEKLRIIVRPENGQTTVLGSDYTGEAKKSFLRNFMYAAKQDGGLGLHAGTKHVRINTDTGLEDIGQIYFGLSGTGKSTLTSHGFNLSGDEYAEMLQDDVCALMPDGSVIGTEGNGLYAKTNGLTDNQEELYNAVTAASAVLENVAVEEDGSVDFFDTELTANGRAAVRRDELASAADHIDLPSVDQVYFITRNRLMPPIAKLSPEQAAATFMLGESVETGAGDPSRTGEAVRVVGFNPFIIGSPGEEGNRLLDLLEQNEIDSYVINTGTVGEQDITVDDTVNVLRENTKNNITWRYDPSFGMELPEQVNGMDAAAYYPPHQVDTFTDDWTSLQTDRQEYLDQFEDLDEDIKNALV